MQKDFHYYTIYVLCRGAGIKPKASRRIAYASQYTDDAKHAHILKFTGGELFAQERTAHEFISISIFSKRVQLPIFAAFHFLPGDLYEREAKYDPPKFRERMICTPDSDTSRELLKKVKINHDSPFAQHALGIALHTYADTFAHQNFSGLCKGFIGAGKINDAAHVRLVDPDTEQTKKYHKGITTQIKDWLFCLLEPLLSITRASFLGALLCLLFYWFFQTNSLESASLLLTAAGICSFTSTLGNESSERGHYEFAKLGHAQVGNLPDEPFRKWQYYHVFYEKNISAENWKIYLEASEKIYNFLSDLIKSNFFKQHDLSQKSVTWNSLKPELEKAFRKSGNTDFRCEYWLAEIKKGSFGFSSSEDKSMGKYNDKEWFEECIDCEGTLWGAGEYIYKFLKKIPLLNHLIYMPLFFNYTLIGAVRFKDSDWKKFHAAACWQKNTVLRDILSKRDMVCG